MTSLGDWQVLSQSYHSCLTVIIVNNALLTLIAYYAGCVDVTVRYPSVRLSRRSTAAATCSRFANDRCPVWARGRCRISPPRFLAECCKRQLNQVSVVLLYFRLSAFCDLYWVCLSVFSCTVLFVSISQVIGCEDRLRNDLYCVGWGVKLYSNQTKPKLTIDVRRLLQLGRGKQISIDSWQRRGIDAVVSDGH